MLNSKSLIWMIGLSLIVFMLSISAKSISDSYIISPGNQSGEMYETGDIIDIHWSNSSGRESSISYNLTYSNDSGMSWNVIDDNITSRLRINIGGSSDNLCYNMVTFRPSYDSYMTKLCVNAKHSNYGALNGNAYFTIYDMLSNGTWVQIWDSSAEGFISSASWTNGQQYCHTISNQVLFKKDSNYTIYPYAPSGSDFMGSYHYQSMNNPDGWDYGIDYPDWNNVCSISASFVRASYQWDTSNETLSDFVYLAGVKTSDGSNPDGFQQSAYPFYIGCIPDYECGAYSACGQYRESCTEAKDLKGCGFEFIGNLSLWDRDCSINANSQDIKFDSFDLRYQGNQFIFMVFVIIWLVCLSLSFILRNHIFYILAFCFGIIIGIMIFQVSWILSIAIILLEGYIGIRYLPKFEN